MRGLQALVICLLCSTPWPGLYAQSPEDADAAREASGGYRGIDPSALMIGTAAEIAAEMQSYGELGYTDFIIRNLHPDPDKAVASIERLADVKKILAG